MFLRCIYLSASARVAMFSTAVSLASVAGAAAAPDVVLYPSDVTTMSGNWARVQSASGAGITKMQSADRGWSSTEQPLANPNDYFEVTFTAPSYTKYHVWLRLRARFRVRSGRSFGKSRFGADPVSCSTSRSTNRNKSHGSSQETSSRLTRSAPNLSARPPCSGSRPPSKSS